MSAYEKRQVGMIDFQASASLHESAGYAAYAPQPYAPNFMFAGADGDELNLVNGPYRPPFEEPPGLADPRIRPDITSYDPREGTDGVPVHVHLQTPHDLRAPPSLSISLLFASKRVNCDVHLLSEADDLVRQYVVVAPAPPFTTTGYHAFSVPLYLVVDGGQGQTVAEVGSFRYDNPVPSNPPRKRKASVDSEISQPLPKKISTQQGRLPDGDGFSYNSTSPYSPFLQTPTNGVYQPTSPKPGHHHSTSTASTASVTAPSPHTPSWSPAAAAVAAVQASRSPAPPMTPARHSATASPVKSANPPLMRTSTIQQGSGGTNVSGQSFNPYSMYPLKAILRLNGDLDAMAEGWSMEEFEAHRRLVQFTRRQNGSTIHADFKAVAPEDRLPNSITVSCIWWEEKKECFVTSVDTIFLLESLVAVRFTVEEKNRIRRNLEGFRPLTVSKSKSDSEGFFKTIMGFPNPKPRNIEKDVKVFPWKVLSQALKKIIGKYSASYSSTASALTPASSTYASTEGSVDHHSPQGLDISAATFPSTAAPFSPHLLSVPLSAPATAGPDLRLQVPPPSYSFHPDYSYTPIAAAMPQPVVSQPMSAPVTRLPNWEYSPYMEASPVAATAINGLSAYGPAVAMVPVTYSMAPPSSGI